MRKTDPKIPDDVALGVVFAKKDKNIRFEDDKIPKVVLSGDERYKEPKIAQDIKIAKVVAAAAMLIYAIGATITALIIFIPKIIR